MSAKNSAEALAPAPDEPALLDGILLADKVGLLVLEEFVQAELEHALRVLADAGGDPPFEERACTLGARDGGDARKQPLELARVGLHVALDYVQRSHEGVRHAASQSSSGQTLRILRCVMRNCM
eukprot:CAMPEP_0116925936 /NCGR_PEP_ID=MMETSP0467-20121206/24422_1 /TAXON_ID=283647 /ORGANISM="Mesodinium pulex, Strain SPMC105" /LENGTH=123 /DNA_ID=CAMNT_0004605089 /DNA_START=612 /DNA_END=982 /DNA_ORIENTATION=+